MRQYNLRFAKRWPDVIFDLYDVNWKENISESLGVYVLGSSDKTDFIYPWGSSPIFYIGKSAGLSKRLSAHRRYILNAYNDHDKNTGSRRTSMVPHLVLQPQFSILQRMRA